MTEMKRNFGVQAINHVSNDAHTKQCTQHTNTNNKHTNTQHKKQDHKQDTHNNQPTNQNKTNNTQATTKQIKSIKHASNHTIK